MKMEFYWVTDTVSADAMCVINTYVVYLLAGGDTPLMPMQVIQQYPAGLFPFLSAHDRQFPITDLDAISKMEMAIMQFELDQR